MYVRRLLRPWLSACLRLAASGTACWGWTPQGCTPSRWLRTMPSRQKRYVCGRVCVRGRLCTPALPAQSHLCPHMTELLIDACMPPSPPPTLLRSLFAQSSVSSSWRLWPFTGWREPSSATKQQPGSSPSTAGALPPAAAAGSASVSSALQPSGGSFTNLRALLAPGNKSAPDRSGYSAGGRGADGSGAPGAAAAGGADIGPPAAGGSRNASFVSTGSSPPRVR
jgi:hypothetical protein